MLDAVALVVGPHLCSELLGPSFETILVVIDASEVTHPGELREMFGGRMSCLALGKVRAPTVFGSLRHHLCARYPRHVSNADTHQWQLRGTY